MKTKEKPQVKKLRNLEDLKELKVGDKLVIKAEKCPFGYEEAAVLNIGDEFKFINSYNSFGDLTVAILTPKEISRIDKRGRLVVRGYEKNQIASRFRNLNELSEEHKSVLSKAGYEIPQGVN